MRDSIEPPRYSRRGWGAAASVATLALACGGEDGTAPEGDPNDLAALQQVLTTNADLAVAMYTDSIRTAEDMRTAIDAFVANPTPATLAAAREAWLIAQEPYDPTEVYRFRSSPIDDTDYDPSNGEDGPELEINSWPLGEGLIDYVVAGSDFGDNHINVTEHQTGVMSPIPQNNIINSTNIPIDENLLAANVSAADERDVITGYHAIEFMLWGQDLNDGGGADAPRDTTPGQRPHTDYLQNQDCTSGPTEHDDGTLCARRAAFLQLVTDKLIDDLTEVRDGFAEGSSYRAAFAEVTDLDTAKRRFLEILTGMGTLSEGELGGERMQIALAANSQEDEHSCFSDNTHRDILLNAEGIAHLFRGEYPGYDSDLDGTVDVTTNAVDGYGIDDYLNAVGQSQLAGEIEAALQTTAGHLEQIDANAKNGIPFDNQIVDPTAPVAMPIIEGIRSLNTQAQRLARIALELELGTVEDVVDPDASECDTTDPTTEC
jgi:putative iron-regulated protein